MADGSTPAHTDESDSAKDFGQSPSGDEPMTSEQRAQLQTLSEQANVPFDGRLTKAQASRRIGELQPRAPHGEPEQRASEEGGLVSPDPTGNPGSLGKVQQSKPNGAPSSA